MLNLKYQVPFTLIESLEENSIGQKDFFIEGIAINSITTDNNHKFVAEELKSAAHSLIGRPLLTDHDDKLRSMAGKVTDAEYDEMTQSIRFKAKVNNTEQGKLAKELIRSGDLNTVSIGANVTSFDETEESIIPRGIKFKELSLVAVPADDNAQFIFHGQTLSLALKEAWKSVHEENNEVKEVKESTSHSIDIVEDNNKIRRRFEMEEDKQMSTESIVKEEKIVEYATKEEFEIKFKAQADLISNILERLSLIESTKVESTEVAVTEAVKVDVKEAEVEVEAKAEEDEEELVDENDKSEYRIVQGFKSFTVEKKKYR